MGEYRIFEEHLPRYITQFTIPPESKPDYKLENIRLLREHVKDDDTVLIIGGGFGVTTVIASELASEGEIVCYEGSRNRVRKISEVLNYNSVQNNVSLIHGIIGDSKGVIGDKTDAEHIKPSDLPSCDLLEIDCEGAEIDILSQMKNYPRKIIVETHPEKGSPTDDIVRILNDAGYIIIDKVPDPSTGHVICAEMKD